MENDVDYHLPLVRIGDSPEKERNMEEGTASVHDLRPVWGMSGVNATSVAFEPRRKSELFMRVSGIEDRWSPTER